jgi:hypothetical protein
MQFTRNREMASLLELRFNIEAPISFSGFTSMPSGYLKVPEKNERLAIRSPGVWPPAVSPDSGEVAAEVGERRWGKASWLT